MGPSSDLASVDPLNVKPNPDNPRRYFNEERLDLLRTSIQEVGILVPLIVYRDTPDDASYVLMDGERRWRSAIDLGLAKVPTNVIEKPTRLDNMLRMFNIHNVREDWPLISVALSLRSVIDESGEERESRLAEMTGLTRSTVRRAKRILSLPSYELELIQAEAHLDRSKQVHREDLYLEIESAVSVIRNELDELVSAYGRDRMIRQLAAKAEEGTLVAVTDFRYVGRLLKAYREGFVNRETTVSAVTKLIEDIQLSPKDLFDDIAADAYAQQQLDRRADLLAGELEAIKGMPLASSLRDRLERLRTLIVDLLESDDDDSV